MVAFRGYGDTDPYAWYDFGMNPDHPPGDAVALELGRNEVLVRVRGGVYSSAGSSHGSQRYRLQVTLLTTTRNRVRGVVFDLDGTLYDNEMPIGRSGKRYGEAARNLATVTFPHQYHVEGARRSGRERQQPLVPAAEPARCRRGAWSTLRRDVGKPLWSWPRVAELPAKLA